MPRSYKHLVGKTTAVQQVVSQGRLAALSASADKPTLQGGAWIETQWDAARLTASRAGEGGAVLVLDEIQKVHWGRLVASAVGAHLVNAASAGDITLSWWRAGNDEVDFIAVDGQRAISIEVKSGAQSGWHHGTAALRKAHRIDRSLVVGTGALTLDEFLSHPALHWRRD